MTFRTAALAALLLITAGAAHAQQIDRAQAQALRAACEADIKRLCPGVSPGGGRLLACVKEKPEQLSAPCASALQKAAAAQKASPAK